MSRIFLAIAGGGAGDHVNTCCEWRKEVIMKNKADILISYAYMTKRMIKECIDYAGQYNLFLDSGAFTAFTKGKPINLDEYCAFVKDPPFPIERYFMLDVIGDREGTWRNLQIMLDKGLHPVPIFTRGEVLERLDEFYKYNDLVCIGGTAGWTGRNGQLKWVMENNKGRNVHWLGVGDIDMILALQPYSADCSSFASGGRWGYGSVYYNGKMIKFERKNFQKIPAVKRFCIKYGINYYDLKKEECWRTGLSLVNQITLMSWFILFERIKEQSQSRIFSVATPGDAANGLSVMLNAYKKKEKNVN